MSTALSTETDQRPAARDVVFDVSHVTFRGLTLEATRGSAAVIRGGASNLIAGCLIRNIGNSGVTIDGSSNTATILNTGSQQIGFLIGRSVV